MSDAYDWADDASYQSYLTSSSSMRFFIAWAIFFSKFSWQYLSIHNIALFKWLKPGFTPF